jgi:peptide/nickel transport system ATP-binding protein
MTTDPLLAASGLEVVVPDGRDGHRTVVDRVSIDLAAGERVGLVGSSGSGKSLTLSAMIGLAPPGAEIRGGRILIDGVEASRIDGFRGGTVGLVLQEAASALNPVYSVGFQLVETLRAHGIARGSEARTRVRELLAEVAFDDPEVVEPAYPFELSGGQAQRVMLALALAGEPTVLLADEPTTGLDTVTEAQILDLLRRITDERGLALLLVSHDLAVIANVVSRVLVMHRGQIVEQGPTDEVLNRPRHPETERLVAAAARRSATTGAP